MNSGNLGAIPKKDLQRSKEQEDVKRKQLSRFLLILFNINEFNAVVSSYLKKN